MTYHPKDTTWTPTVRETVGGSHGTGLLDRYSVHTSDHPPRRNWICDLRDFPSQTAKELAYIIAEAPELVRAVELILPGLACFPYEKGLSKYPCLSVEEPGINVDDPNYPEYDPEYCAACQLRAAWLRATNPYRARLWPDFYLEAATTQDGAYLWDADDAWIAARSIQRRPWTVPEGEAK